MPEASVPRTVGVGYLRAVMLQDEVAIRTYRQAYTDAELLHSLITTARVLLLRVSALQDQCASQLLESLAAAASYNDQMHDEVWEP